MIAFKFHILLFITIVISSCSNLLTWHLDKGIHKITKESDKIDTINSVNALPIKNMNIRSNILWSTSVNSAPDGNTGYLRIEKIIMKNELKSLKKLFRIRGDEDIWIIFRFL